MNELIKYFDLASEVRPKRPTERAATRDTKTLHWLPQYFALVLGISLQPFIKGYMTNGSWTYQGLGGWIIASLVIALMIFPGVYKSSFDPEKPIFVQLCVIFTSGMGWQSLLGATGEALGGN
jgi:hypothetical protein